MQYTRGPSNYSYKVTVILNDYNHCVCNDWLWFNRRANTYSVPNAVQRLTRVAVRSYEVTGRGGLAMRDHVGETGANTHIVVQFLRGTLGPCHHLLYGRRLAPTVLIRIQDDVVNLCEKYIV